MLDRVKVAVKDNSHVIRDPKTRQRLTTEGLVVPKNAFWLRRIKDGDVIVLEEIAVEQPQDPVQEEPAAPVVEAETSNSEGE